MRLRNVVLLGGLLVVLGLVDSAKYNSRVQTCSALAHAVRTAKGVSTDCTAATAWVLLGSVAVLFGFILVVVAFAQHVQRRDPDGPGSPADGSCRIDAGDGREPAVRYGGPPPTAFTPAPRLRSSVRPGKVSVSERPDIGPGPTARPRGPAPLKGTLRRRGRPGD